MDKMRRIQTINVLGLHLENHHQGKKALLIYQDQKAAFVRLISEKEQ